MTYLHLKHDFARKNNIHEITKPPYLDLTQLKKTQDKIKSLPRFIDHKKVDKLTTILQSAYHNNTFILQCGDCAERFSEATTKITKKKYNHLYDLQKAMRPMMNQSLCLIGRMAGQYAKPRSSIYETIANKVMFAYHGDLINSEYPFGSRQADHRRLLYAYDSAQHIIRAMPKNRKFIFMSHECFQLEYETATTDLIHGDYYNLSTHFPWLGMRNIASEDHVNYLQQIKNPVGIKIGPHIHTNTLLSVLKKINPHNSIGKVALITRLGTEQVKTILPTLIDFVHQHGLHVVWICDPMHGNTYKDKYGLKYRLIPQLTEETISTIKILKQKKTHLSGIHLETSYRDDINECIYSKEELNKDRCYDSAMDPRLSHAQSLDFLETICDYCNHEEVINR